MLVALLSPLAALAGCILAEPAGDLPTLPLSRPTIVEGSVVPSTTSVLGAFPAALEVPVELSDPRLSFQYATFIDYNSFTQEGLVDGPRTSAYDPQATSTVGRIRTIKIPINPPPDIDRCHVIEVVVALRFIASVDPRSAHTPDEPGGDIVTWFYSPGGDLRGCPTLDAGIGASIGIPDADAASDGDAAEGGPT